jgi:hypothetical protein
MGAGSARTAARGDRRRCLIVERHEWETGGRQQQLQFVLETARRFFGGGDKDRRIRVRVFLPPTAEQPAFQRDIVISREYQNGTRRTNGFPEMGGIPSAFVFFEETGAAGVYDVWWQMDKAVVAARFRGWAQGRNTQYGRGRLSIIVPAPVERLIQRVRVDGTGS